MDELLYNFRAALVCQLIIDSAADFLVPEEPESRREWARWQIDDAEEGINALLTGKSVTFCRYFWQKVDQARAERLVQTRQDDRCALVVYRVTATL